MLRGVQSSVRADKGWRPAGSPGVLSPSLVRRAHAVHSAGVLERFLSPRGVFGDSTKGRCEKTALKSKSDVARVVGRTHSTDVTVLGCYPPGLVPGRTMAD